MMDQSMVTLGWVILMWKFILLKLSPCLWVKSGGNWQFIDERDGEKAFLGNQNNKCLHILSFSSTRLSALKIVSLILSKDRKINAYGKEPTANAGDVRDTGLIPGLERSPGGGHGNPLRCSRWGNPMDRGGWQTAVHSVSQSQRRLKRLSTAQLVDRAVFRHRDSWWRNTLWHSIKSLNL